MAILAAALILLLGAAALAEDVCPYCGGKLTVGQWESFGTESHSRAMLCEDCGGECDREYQAHSGGTATCVRGRICEVCGATYGIPDPFAHDYVWRPNGDGTHTQVCQREGCSYTEGDVQPGSGGSTLCTENAVCALCGGTYRTAGEHSFIYTPNNDGTHNVSCSNTDCTYAETNVACSGGSAFCTEAAVCTLCGGTYRTAGEHSLTYTSNNDGTHNVSCSNTGCTYAETNIACSGGKATCTQRAVFLKDLLHNGSLPFAFLP